MKYFFLILRYFGWRKTRKISKIKAESAQADTQILLTNWMKEACRAINKELESQLSINGFDGEKIRSGLFILTCEISEDPAEPSIKNQTYRVGNIEVLRVTWKLNGFTIHVRPRQEAKEIKKALDKGMKKIFPAGSTIIAPEMGDDGKLTLQALQMVEEFEKSPAPKLHIEK